MGKYTNVVRFSVKIGLQDEFERVFAKIEKIEGQLLLILAKTGDQTYVSYGLWESEEKMITARTSMIAQLDSLRNFLEEISPELGVTDPVSGPVIYEI